MSSYRQLFYHIVFHTRGAEKTIDDIHSKELYNYIWGIVKNKNSKLYQINGIEDHIHMLADIHPTIPVSDFVRDVKSFSSSWMKQSGYFQKFKGWAEGFGVFTVSYKEKDMIIGYIKKQKEHHKSFSFEEEYRNLLLEQGIAIDEKYFLK
ncbi:IS200/IS605 family transposase [Algoriphagus sp. A40]|uniref:IS200/IS605 family transposase n=1 Tax=Algoriphagus sp. A40 TaxID=1945863 RepID=UPI0009872490|nr:IS200/IS605 family transposase [Algoriphagus sp. A40]OOG78308.1 transposase [Algoriphagus sp. A40]